MVAMAARSFTERAGPEAGVSSVSVRSSWSVGAPMAPGRVLIGYIVRQRTPWCAGEFNIQDFPRKVIRHK